MRYLGIDYGRKRIGLALSDEDEILASPLPLFERKRPGAELQFLDSLAKQHDVGGFVIGLPKNMDGSLGPMAQEVMRFSAELRRITGRPVIMIDERRTSFEAERILVAADLSRKRRRKVQDSVAAVLILQRHLDQQRPARSETRI
ncbi:Holliday junction resolvase RuvX [Candidatus Bipolaricaulota bacterium]|nr:Holliday junction resolvase RuvX [Candidatus Bipolaricaulota bacterium]